MFYFTYLVENHKMNQNSKAIKIYKIKFISLVAFFFLGRLKTLILFDSSLYFLLNKSSVYKLSPI